MGKRSVASHSATSTSRLPLGGDELATDERQGGSLREKRRYPRQAGHFDIWLLYNDGETVLRCRADNVSKGGAHALVPAGYDVRKGQRYQVHICPASPWAGFGSAMRVLGEARVVRADPEDEQEREVIGVALKFDSHSDWLAPASSSTPADRPC